ncbi:serine hydrolase domain-containing protein [Pseudomonas typographi]|uniref:Beta-lactamase family protein n=1 Tax=Pseudomonas typographi TaxID=2715964 RepID=A0ABR7Z8I5_9PSED|nr:serine hydrolase domain-containing protein [Pseudomonas typographi]MBD1588659.1 beta-lactamase family protein [Pseudomonas typographi]MBD1601628.1 beta-lactamase family protein [Pseudomonas typographi]
MLRSLVSQGQPPTPEPSGTMIPWWSFTKTVLATTALSLVRDGQVGLDTEVLDQPFTLRQLLRHEAGLADYGELAGYHAAVANSEPAWSADEMMQRLDGLRLRYNPGTGWRYSNVGYLLIGRLIEQLTDLALEEAVDQRAIIPLGLSGVRFAKTRADLQTTVLGVTCNYDPAWVYHGLLIGPVSQAALFLYRLFAGKLLSQDLLQEMQTVRTLGGPIPDRPWIIPGYGLGVMKGSINGGFSLCGHTGCGPGSTIAVYRISDGDVSACCAVFDTGATEGYIEDLVAGTLVKALRRNS